MEIGSTGRSLLILFRCDTEQCDLVYRHLLEEFESNFDIICEFNDQDETVEFIRNCSQHDYIFLVYVGKLAEAVQTDFIHLVNLHSIYVYDYKSIVYRRSLISPSAKIRGIESTIEKLFKKIFDDLVQDQSEQELIRKIVELVTTYSDLQPTGLSCEENITLPNSGIHSNDSNDFVQCPLYSIGCVQLIDRTNEHKHYTSDEHISFLHPTIGFLMADIDSFAKNVQLNHKIQDFQSDSSLATARTLRNFAQNIEYLTQLTVDIYSSLKIPFRTSHNNESKVFFSSMISTLNEINLQQDGVLVWPITNLIERTNKFRSDSTQSIESPVFQSCARGPKIVARLFFNGKISDIEFISIYVYLVVPEKQSFLGDFKFTLVDVSGNKPLCPLVKYFDASKIPMTDYIGIEDFICKRHLSDFSQYIRKDLSFLIIQTRPADELDFTPIPIAMKQTLDSLMKLS